MKDNLLKLTRSIQDFKQTDPDTMFLTAAANSVPASTHHGHSDSGHLQHHLQHFTHLACQIVTLAVTVILVGGVLLGVINIIQTLINLATDSKLRMLCSISYKEKTKPRLASFGRVRQQLGEITALGLEVLIVADILETLIIPASQFDWHSLGKIIAIAVVRTVLAVMLGREIKEIEEKIEGAGEAAGHEALKHAHHE